MINRFYKQWFDKHEIYVLQFESVPLNISCSSGLYTRGEFKTHVQNHQRIIIDYQHRKIFNFILHIDYCTCIYV